jgi:membrane-bound ClpP family serine protease
VLELKMPGLGLPGVVAALCFVVFFWAHYNNEAAGITLLAVLLFILGLVLIGLEVFMLPGSAVFGISGVVLLVSSLTLVTIDHWPQTTNEWVGLGSWVGAFALSLGGAVVSALVLAWYLPHLPYVNRLILKPPGEAVDEDGVPEPGPAPAQTYAALLGAIGVAATPLRPAGKVQFGDQFVDVVAESGYVEPGTRVQVVEIEGMRVVVKEI